MKNKGKISTALTVIIKGPKLLKTLKLVKFLKFAKPLITILSIAISICAYAIVYSPWLAVGLVVVIFAHEMGHVIAMNREGYKTSGPVFIPFLGAALFAPKGMDRRQEAVIGIGGPLLGSLFSFLLIGLYYLTGGNWLLIMGYIGIFLNLFNMIPISPLDGGRVTQAVGKYFKIVGIALLIAVTIALKNPGILLIWIIVFFDFYFLPVKIRFTLAAITELAMITMLLTGTGIVNRSIFWSTIVDVAIGALYLTMIGISIFKNPKETEEILNQGAQRPELAAKEKFQWFLIWLSIAAILYIALLLLKPALKIIMMS